MNHLTLQNKILKLINLISGILVLNIFILVQKILIVKLNFKLNGLKERLELFLNQVKTKSLKGFLKFFIFIICLVPLVIIFTKGTSQHF